MPKHAKLGLVERSVDELTIVDERSFRHIPLYEELKEVLRRDGYVFRILPQNGKKRWDRALFLNLTYWGAAGGDVLESDRIPADVVAHAAWHHVASAALGGKVGRGQSPEALFAGEAVASAFDVYLVGRLLGTAPRSSFLATQVPALADAAVAAGLSARGARTLVEGICDDPARAFADLRELLFDASRALSACPSTTEALAALERFDGHRFAPLLHHYELSNWVLFARAYGTSAGRRGKPDPHVTAVEKALRTTPVPLAWLGANWVAPMLDPPAPA